MNGPNPSNPLTKKQVFPHISAEKGPLLWNIQVLLSKSDKFRHLSTHLDQNHLALGCHPSQTLNPGQHLGPYFLAYRDFCHLKRDDPAMPNHLRSDLDQLGQ